MSRKASSVKRLYKKMKVGLIRKEELTSNQLRQLRKCYPHLFE